MNFNYDLTTWINYFIGAFFCCFGMFIQSKILLFKKNKDLKKYKCFLLIPLTIFMIFNNLAFNNVLTMFGTLLVYLLIYRYILEEKGGKIFLYTIVSYMILSLVEIFFVLVVSLFDYIFKYSIATIINKSVYSNIIISILFCITSFYLRNFLKRNINKISTTNFWLTLLQGALTLFVIIASINYLYIEKWKFSYEFILILIMIFGSVSITISLIKQYLKNKEVVDKQKMLQEYLKTSADLIEKYSSTQHKYKNNLIIIKSFLKKDNIDANNYIDNILDKFENKKYTWVSKINYIPIETIRYLIYYKLSKAEEANINLFINVSKEVKQVKNNFMNTNELSHVLDILGEYFDNAIYASNESKEKQLNFDLYILNDQLVFNIANTYKDSIDLNLINRNGYTTKGKGHGFGLYDIAKSIKNINILSNNYEIVDNFFVASLIIKLNKKTIDN